MTIGEAFGIVVKRFRKERNITQDMLSSASRLDRAFISKIENGKQQPSLVTIIELAKALNISAASLIFEVEFILCVNHPEVFQATHQTELCDWKKCTGGFVSEICDDYVGSEMIMVVDDEDMIRSMLANFLISYGYMVVTAENGLDAIEKYRHNPAIDLIVMDIVMPVKDGIAASEELLITDPGVNILLISGYTTKQLNRSEQINYLQKPFAPIELIRSIRGILDRKKLSQVCN